MKKKVLLTSVMTIMLCISLIAGATFALFTSTSKVGISIEAAEVDMFADIVDLKLWSVEADPNAADDVKVVDENGNVYKYVDRTAEQSFTNGGTAVFENAVLTMERVTPGDKVSFTLTGANSSNVAIQYRYIIECLSGHELMSGFNVYVNGVKYEALDSYTTAWAPLAAKTDMANVAIEVELPVTAGNEYQGLEAELRIVVEAVQGNAVTENPDTLINYVTRAFDAESAADAIENAQPGETIALAAGEYGDVDITGNIKDVTIVATPETEGRFKIKSGAVLENVTFEGLDIGGNGFASYDGVVSVEAGANADLTFKDCTFAPNAGYSSVRSYDPTAKLEFIGCTFESGRYAVYKSGDPVSELVFKDCKFNNITSWIYQSHGGANPVKVVVDGCTFDNCTGGLFKSGGTYVAGSEFIFTNNVLADNCTGHDGKTTKWFELDVTAATVEVSGNKLGANEWVPAAAEGLKY